MKSVVSPLGAKAVGLLRSHYVYTRRLVYTGFNGGGRIPEFTWDFGVFNTRTGARVLGFGEKTFRELWSKKLLAKPAAFHVLKRGAPDRVYTLSSSAMEAVVIISVIQAVRETFAEARR